MIQHVFYLVGITALSVLLVIQHKTYTTQISDLIKALIAKNPREYMDMKHEDSDTADEEFQSDEIPFSELDDETFLKAIGKDK